MATKSQGSVLAIETVRATAKTITSVAVAAGVVTVTATGHGYAAGDVVFIDGVATLVDINGRVFRVDTAPATDTFVLKGVDGTNYPAAGTGGTVQKLTMTNIGKVTNINAPSAAASDIDTTHLRSVTKEFLAGLGDEGDASFDLILDNADVGQAALRLAREAQAVKGFTVTDSAGKVACFPGSVKQFGFTAGPNDVYKGTVSVKIAAAKSWFA